MLEGAAEEDGERQALTAARSARAVSRNTSGEGMPSPMLSPLWEPSAELLELSEPRQSPTDEPMS
jgi:hypothetical protein